MTSINAHPKGQSMEQLSEDWWRWALDLETNGGKNAFQDQTGHYASAGHGVDKNLFFLAGIAGNSAIPVGEVQKAERSFKVPSSDAVLVPVINTAESVPDYEFTTQTTNATPADVEKYIHDWHDSYVTSKFLTVDGKPVSLDKNYVETDFFSLGQLQPGHVGLDVFQMGPAYVEQEPAMAGGYWAVINGLGVGDHTVVFGGSLDFNSDGKNDFSYEITDHITVVPPSKYSTELGSPMAAPAFGLSNTSMSAMDLFAVGGGALTY